MIHRMKQAMRVARGVGILGLSLVAAGCTPLDALNATVAEEGVEVTRDVAYGAGPRRQLDVYRLPGAVARPVVVFFYGGSWRSGRRQDYRFVGTALARRGLVAVVADYRVFPEVGFPDFLTDAAQATALVRRQAAGWGGDPKRIVLAGHSAGAHIAAMVALDPRLLAAAGMDRAEIAGLVGLAGPYDFLPMTGAGVRAVFGAAADSPASQPVTFADGAAPPALLLHGADDTTVLPRNSLSLAARIAGAGGSARAVVYPGTGHIGILMAFAPLFTGRAPVVEELVAFVEGLPGGK
jgi:acetyl esterase/lipase